VSAPAIGYLVSRYPAVSHTFILREVQRLRELGHSIHAASINDPDRAEADMDPVELAEASSTYFIKRDGARGAAAAVAYWMSTSPLTMLAILRQGQRLAPGGLGLAYAVEAAMIGRWMARKGLKHLHVHFANAAATVSLLVKQLTGCHLSCTVHGPDEFDDVPGQHLARKIASFDRIVCISQFAKGQLMRIGSPQHWDKIEVCRLGVNPADFPRAHRERSVGPIRLLCVGRLTPAKGQFLLVQALARVRERGLDATLTMVGHGPDKERLHAAVRSLGVESHVRFTGPLRQDQVRDAMAAADVFVLPSLAEGIPVVLMEAMATGLPTISTPVNGIPELISHGQCGLLATPGCVDSLVTQIEAVAASTDLQRRLADAGRAKVLSHFDLGVNTARLGEIFRTFPAARIV
jgi:colanic acid/amylovoran biosynthesis glycosyltransferase